MLEEKPTVEIVNHSAQESADTFLSSVSSVDGGAILPQSLMDELVSLYGMGDLSGVVSKSSALASDYPRSNVLWNILGAAYVGLDDWVAAEVSFSKAIAANPCYPDAHNNLGILFRAQGRINEALESFRHAIRLKPDYVEALFNLGICYLNNREVKLAQTTFSQALSIEPNNVQALFKLISSKLSMFDWKEMDCYKERVLALIEQGNSASPLDIIPIIDDPKHQKDSAISYVSRKVGPGDTENYHVFGNQKIRLAYFSGEYHKEDVADFASELFKTHDRDLFEIYAYSYGPEVENESRHKVINSIDVFDSVTEFSDQASALLARQDTIDIAIDLTGLSESARPGIFAQRAAPIQINYLGYPGTSGLVQCDYIIADEYIIPSQDQNHYIENVLYLPNYYQISSRREALQTAGNRRKFGLKDGSFIFCCFNNQKKISPDEVLSWSNILNKTENSVIWLLVENEEAKDNILRLFNMRGINENRIIFGEYENRDIHFQRYHFADLFLDTFNFNGHTTAKDALCFGVPTVTRSGRSFASRVTGSLLKTLDLNELITTTSGAYEDLAIKIANNKEYREKLKKKLKKRIQKSPLVGTKAQVKNLESLYQKVYLENKNSKTV